MQISNRISITVSAIKQEVYIRGHWSVLVTLYKKLHHSQVKKKKKAINYTIEQCGNTSTTYKTQIFYTSKVNNFISEFLFFLYSFSDRIFS